MFGVEDYTIEVTEQDNHCAITLDGENLGFIIGRRGETLDALQYLGYILIFPGFLFCFVVGLLLCGIDRKLVAKMHIFRNLKSSVSIEEV